MIKSQAKRSPSIQSPTPELRCGGLLLRKELWVPSVRGWLALIGGILVMGCLVFFESRPFLAITARAQPDVLVVDGWIPEYALLEGWQEFQDYHYKTLLTSGGPFLSRVKLDPDDDYADLGAEKLKKLVGPQCPVHPAPSTEATRDRTFTSALAVRQWLEKNGLHPASVTIATLGPHARRSRLLYEKAFGPGMAIGVVSLTSQDYDVRRWWMYSEGVKEMIAEGTGYIYARLFM